jgi:DNA-binding transcriptional MerR regulator
MPQLSLFDPLQPAPETGKKKAPAVDTAALDKVYYTITEVAAMFKVNASLLRFWEKEFPQQLGRLKKNRKGDRFFSKADIEQLKTIYHLVKEQRLTLEGARARLKERKKTDADPVELIGQLQDLKRFLLELRQQLGRST